MEIIKRSGKREEFNISKIEQSIINASTGINEPLTDADLKVIEKEVINILKVLNTKETSSYEIFGIVLKVLNKLGFNDVCKSYLEGSIDL